MMKSPPFKCQVSTRYSKLTCCNQNGWGYVDHSNISPEHHLKRSGLHLNTKGTARLATNFINYLRGDQGIADWEKDELLPPRINRKHTNNKGNPSTINPFGRGFVMVALNINSLLAHLDDLKFFVLDSKIDVLAINETKIDSSVSDNEIYLRGFEVVRKDRSVNGRSGGGVCMYLRSNINYQISDDLCDGQLEYCRRNYQTPLQTFHCQYVV